MQPPPNTHTPHSSDTLLPLGADHLQSFLFKHRIHAELLRDLGKTPTVEDAAKALQVSPERVAKTLLFLIQPTADEGGAPRPIVVVSHGRRQVSKKAIAAHVGVGRKRIKLATPESVIHWLGYPVGGVSPLGHRKQVPLLLDASIVALEQHEDGRKGLLFAGGGDDETMMRIAIQELIRVTNPTILELSEPSKKPM